MDFTNQLKAKGMHYKEAIILASKERMRPILMTTLAMAIGMMPIANGEGNSQRMEKWIGLGNYWWIAFVYDSDGLLGP